MAEVHRVTISGDLYQALRLYMVTHQLPHVRAALEEVIRAEVGDDQPTQQEEVPGTDTGNGKGGRRGAAVRT